MIKRLYVYESARLDPYRNLAVEECLLQQATDCAILYLWQNENTVVIGKNQNAWKECRATLLTGEGGCLARRLSGGGAVYHDLGNLNFTILLPQEDFDLSRQFSVIRRAVEGLGIPVECSGRNDLLVQGRKFSGSAFYKNGKQAYHHGTLMIRGDLIKLGRYLSPSKLKLQAKGVDSVRSRVANLSQWKEDLTLGQMKQALKEAFSLVYGLPLEPLSDLDEDAVNRLAARNGSWEWNYGQKIPFTCSLEGRFPWGGMELFLDVRQGRIDGVKIYTDAMETRWTEPLEAALKGCPMEIKTIHSRISHLEMGEDVCSLLNDM